MLRLQKRLEEAREHALAGVEAAERSDHAYRDTFRAYGLTVLGRVALDQGDETAAHAAFTQVLAQVGGRPRTRSCGHLAVQALAGLARATRDTASFDEAQRTFDSRQTFRFEPFYGAMDDVTLFELALAADALERRDDARHLLQRARQAGSLRSLPNRPA